MRHVIREVRPPQKPLARIGTCIYCGNAPPDCELTDEHVIPDGLGGDLYLPDASCHNCNSMTTAFETPVLRDVFRYGRGLLGVRSRKRRGKAQRPLTYIAGATGTGEPLQEFLANSQMPFMFGYPSFTGRPNILEAFPVEGDDPRLKWVVGPREFREEQSRLQLKIDTVSFWRTIAKIAHCYTIGQIGLDGFEHRLLPFIKGTVRPPPRSLLGNIVSIGPDEPGALHWIEMRDVSTWAGFQGGKRFARLAIVRMQLFASYGSPIYEVIAGEIR